jgi:hypothetical protein
MCNTLVWEKSFLSFQGHNLLQVQGLLVYFKNLQVIFIVHASLKILCKNHAELRTVRRWLMFLEQK